MVTLVKPNWQKKIMVLEQYGIRVVSELEVSLAMCITYKFNQKELLITFEKAARRDITILVRK